MDASTTAKAQTRVLIADDEAALARSIARVLTVSGFHVTTVGDGASAVEAVKTGAFDVVLSDIHMPGVSGVELLRVVRDADLDVPVVLMTADPRVETAAEAVELGALQYLLKPIATDKLVGSMERAAKMRLMAQMKRQTMKLLSQESAEHADLAKLERDFEACLASTWMAFQPIVAGPDGKLFGYEALLRSREKSLPHPGAVIGAAERLDRLPELGRKIRGLVAKEIEALPDDGVLVFVNLHTRDLLDPSLASASEPLSQHARRVVLEITERGALDDIKDVRARVASLRGLGYRIAIDDLGAGYAGLTSFALLEPEFVKFDMSLVRNVHTSPIRQKLIGSMTQLCREMGMRVVAEGIETVEERDAVVGLQCDLLQGYLFGRPSAPFAPAVWP